jgi:hypothetical protein
MLKMRYSLGRSESTNNDDPAARAFAVDECAQMLMVSWCLRVWVVYYSMEFI